MGLVGGQGFVEDCLPLIVHVDVIDREGVEIFSHFICPLLFCYEVCESGLFFVYELCDFFLDVALKTVKCGLEVLVCVGFYGWVV